MKNTMTFILLVLLTNTFGAGKWALYWSDEFDSTALNTSYWAVRSANPGWVNNEQQRYVAGHDQAGTNIFVANGHLNIFALKNASTGEITSGRIESGGKKWFQYGRMEARMRLPVTQGYWPAFWMLGTVGSWPTCGEIDIMEGKGRLPAWTSGAFHSAQGNPVMTNSYTMPSGNIHDSFHIYAVEWSTDSIRWYFEDQNFLTLTKAAHAGIPIDNNYYFILNVAIGGMFDGNYDNTTVFPESLIVDYVRVYKWDTSVETGAAPAKSVRPAVMVAGGILSVALPRAASTSHSQFRVRLFSPDGAQVRTATGTGQSPLAMPLSGITEGVYFLSIKGTSINITERIIIRP
jgi:beta-glucanase (GH16 family)